MPNKSAGSVDPGPYPESLSFALRRAQAAVTEDLIARFGPDGIRPGQFGALSLLQRSPGLRQSQMSAALGILRTNLVPLLSELVARGLVERHGEPTDRRAAGLYLTDAGRATLARLQALADAHERKFAGRLAAGERAILLGLLARLADPGFDPG